MKDDREKRAGLPSGIAERLADFTCRRRRAWLLRGLGEACLVLLLGLLLVAAIDAGIGLRGALVVVAGLACYAAALAVVAIRGLLPRLRRHSPTEVAHAMEQAVGGMEERLSSAVELAAAPQPGVSGWMVRRTIELADEEIGRTNPATLVDAAPVRLAWRRVLGPLAVMILLCAIPQTRPFALRALLPGIRIARPSATRLMVDPGNGRFAMGTPLTLVVEATPVPAAVDTVVRWDDGLSEVLPLVPDPEREGRFAVTFPALSQGFTYQVRGGDAESLRYAIQVDAPPRVERLGLRITPADPAQPPKLVEGGDADVPAGATVEMTAVLAGPAAAAAEVVREPGERLVLSLDGTTATGSLPAVASFRYRLRLVGQDGIVGDSPQEWQIRVLADAPPTVQLTAAGLPAGLVGRNEILPMDVEADDDRGLVEVKLVLNVGGVVREVIRLPLPGPGTRSVKLDVPLALRHVPVKVGETIEVSLAATDTGGQTSTTVPVNLTVMEGAPAATAKLAAALRGALDEVKAQEARLRTERQAWMELARKFRPEDADTNRGAALMAEQRLEALAAAVAKAAEAVRTAAKEPSQHAENTDVAAAVADSLADWARTRENILSNAAERVAKNHEPDRESVAAMRDLVAESGRELAELRRDLGILAARVEVEDLSAQAEVARARQERNRRLLEAVEGWNAEALRQKPDDRKNQDLAARMAELPADAVKTATDQLRQDYDTLAAVPKALQRMADDAGLEPLGKLAESMKEPGRKMEETSAAMAEKTPDSTSLEAVSAPANALAQGTKQARDALARDLQDVARRHRREPGRIGDLLAAAKRIEDRAQKIPELGRDRSEMEQDALRRQSLAMLQEEQKELASDAEAVSREFLARAADPEVALGERQSVFQAREKLRKDLAPALAKAAAALAQPEPDPARTAQAYRNAAKQADRPLNSAKQEERQAMEERKAALARDALDKLARSAATPPPAGNPAAQEVAAQKLDAAVEELAGLQQELGQRNEADTLAAAAEKNVDNQNAKALAEQLKRSARPEKVEPWKMNQELREEASRLRAEPGAKAQAADRLADAALKLDLTAEAAERRGHREDGRAYRQVGDDLAALLAKPEALSPEALDPLAERVDAIENRRGDPARKEELARAAAREEQAAAADPALARMQELAALAEQAKRAMDRVEERQPLAQELARVAADPAQASAEAAAAGKALAEKLAQDAAELADLARAAAKAESMHQAERAEFAKTEQAVAQSLRGLSPEAQQAADVAQRQPLRDALAKAKGELPKLADHISRLGESAQPSAAQPDASTQAPQVQAVPPDSRQLADEARRQADAMSQSMTKPLAESVIQPGAAHPGEPANPKVEALGKAMANLTAEQRRAADRLERRAEGAERTGTELIERLQAAEQAAAAARAMLAEQGIPPPTPSLPEGEAGLAAPLSPVQRAHMASRDLQAMAAKLAGSPPAAPPPDAPGEAPAPQEVASKNAPPPAATPSSAQAAQEALAAVAAAPAQRQSYQQAADILNRAASQQRSKRAMAANPAAAAAKAETAAAKAQGLAQGVNREHAGTDPAAIASDAPVGGADGADWARLSRRLRTDIHGGAADAFPEEHREPIRAYFRRLAEEKQ